MPETPLVASIINAFAQNKKFLGQTEEKVYKKIGGKLKIAQNSKFVDATFQSMLKGVGWQSGQAWCAYFVKVFLMAFYSFDANFINKNFTGGAVNNLRVIQSLNKSGNKTWLAVTTGLPQVGDVVVWQSLKNSINGHTGIISAIDSKEITTIEGNTSAQKNSREGDLVATKIRPANKIQINATLGDLKLIGFIRRVFTEEEANKLYFDEEEQTLKFKA